MLMFALKEKKQSMKANLPNNFIFTQKGRFKRSGLLLSALRT